MILFSLCLFLIYCKSVPIGTAPDPKRFAGEIAKFKNIKYDQNKECIVFTGSSSIRMWRDIQSYYPNHQIINTGFGGSEMSNLLHYLEKVVLRFAPSKVFIYEGDNDISAKRPIKTIMKNTKAVVQLIQKKYPNCQVVLISAKPSIARWHLKTAYEDLNLEFKKYATKKNMVEYAHIWDVMLEADGTVNKSIFIADGLHMNKQGYDLWDKVLKPFVVAH